MFFDCWLTEKFAVSQDPNNNKTKATQLFMLTASFVVIITSCILFLELTRTAMSKYFFIEVRKTLLVDFFLLIYTILYVDPKRYDVYEHVLRFKDCFSIDASAARLAKTKADIANKNSHSCLSRCVDFKQLQCIRTKMLYCLPYFTRQHTPAVNEKYVDIRKIGRRYNIVVLKILMLFQK